MNLLVVACAVVTGLLRGFALRDLLDYPFRGYAQFYAALILQIMLGTAHAEASSLVRTLAPLLNLGSMGLLLWALYLNRQLIGSRLIVAGVMANLAVIFANGGKMPVSLSALHAVGMPATRVAYLAAGRSLTHRLMETGAPLWRLGDVFYLPRPLPRSPVFSVGDIVLAIGLFVLINEAMGRHARQRKAVSNASFAIVPATEVLAAAEPCQSEPAGEGLTRDDNPCSQPL